MALPRLQRRRGWRRTALSPRPTSLIHQFLQHRLRPSRQIQCQQAIGQRLLQILVVAGVGHQIGVLVHHGDELDRRHCAAVARVADHRRRTVSFSRSCRRRPVPGNRPRPAAASPAPPRQAPVCPRSSATRSRSASSRASPRQAYSNLSSASAAWVLSSARVARRNSTARIAARARSNWSCPLARASSSAKRLIGFALGLSHQRPGVGQLGIVLALLQQPRRRADLAALDHRLDDQRQDAVANRRRILQRQRRRRGEHRRGSGRAFIQHRQPHRPPERDFIRAVQAWVRQAVGFGGSARPAARQSRSAPRCRRCGFPRVLFGCHMQQAFGLGGQAERDHAFGRGVMSSARAPVAARRRHRSTAPSRAA